MGGPLAIVGFLALILLVVIPIHEFGHLLVARRFGFKVQEYFVGFGTKLWSTKRGETEYGIKAIPAGGYVKIAGMNPYETVPAHDVARAYGSKPIRPRALVILAGPLSHVLVGGLRYLPLFVTYGDTNTELGVVGEVVRRREPEDVVREVPVQPDPEDVLAVDWEVVADGEPAA